MLNKNLFRHCNMVLEQVKEMWTEMPKTGKGCLEYYLYLKILTTILRNF